MENGLTIPGWLAFGNQFHVRWHLRSHEEGGTFCARLHYLDATLALGSRSLRLSCSISVSLSGTLGAGRDKPALIGDSIAHSIR